MTGPRGVGGGAAGDGTPDAARGTPEERLRALESAAPGSTGMSEPPPARPTVDDPDPPAAPAVVDLPAPGLPPRVLAGIDRALAAERMRAVAPTPVVPARRRPFLLVVAALVLLVAVGAATAVATGSDAVRPGSVPGPGPGGPLTAALPPGGPPRSTAPVPVLGRGDLPSALRTGLGAADAGPLTDPARLTACLRAQPAPPALAPVGLRRVVLDGVPGVLVVLPTGVAARFRLLVVGEDCGDGRPATLADTVVGR